LWVAEDADEMLGFAWSWICGDLWFLAQLFVSPGHQGRSIVIGRIRVTTLAEPNLPTTSDRTATALAD
jgi:hypothetical protein